MGWYGKFLVKKLKLAFYLRRMNKENLFSDFDLLDRFLEKYDKLREDIDYVQEIAEENKNFSAKATAINISDISYLFINKGNFRYNCEFYASGIFCCFFF